MVSKGALESTIIYCDILDYWNSESRESRRSYPHISIYAAEIIPVQTLNVRCVIVVFLNCEIQHMERVLAMAMPV